MRVASDRIRRTRCSRKETLEEYERSFCERATRKS
jgi:hypothetical protein